MDIEGLKSELAEMMTSDVELLGIMEHFLKTHSDIEAELLSCGACGIRDFSVPGAHWHKLDLTEEWHPLQHSEEEFARFKACMVDKDQCISIPTDANWSLSSVEVWNVRSFHKWTGNVVASPS